MGFFKEFKEFAAKGSVIDLATGVIIGAAFTKITTSLVNNILMPLLGYFIGYIQLEELKVELPIPGLLGEAREPIVISYGAFLQSLLDFVIIAFCIFLLIRSINRLKRRAENPQETSTPTPKDIELLTEIRDALRTNPASNRK